MIEFGGRIGHLGEIESPWSNAGGIVKTTDDVLKMAQTGVGTIEDGSHVLGGRRLGNSWNEVTQQFDIKVYDHDPETGETYNSLGMPGEGFDRTLDEVTERISITHAYGKKYILNVAPVTDDPLLEVQEMVIRAYEKGVDAVLVNAGCPNVILEGGGRHELLSRNYPSFAKVLFGLGGAKLPKPIFVRISPQETEGDMSDICKIAMWSGVVSAVYTPNTWPGNIPKDKDGKNILGVKDGIGGLSGPSTANKSLLQTAWATKCLEGSRVDVVTSGGIMVADTLRNALKLGAVAGAGTTFFYEPKNGWAEDTHRLLSNLDE